MDIAYLPVSYHEDVYLEVMTKHVVKYSTLHLHQNSSKKKNHKTVRKQTHTQKERAERERERMRLPWHSICAIKCACYLKPIGAHRILVETFLLSHIILVRREFFYLIFCLVSTQNSKGLIHCSNTVVTKVSREEFGLKVWSFFLSLSSYLINIHKMNERANCHWESQLFPMLSVFCVAFNTNTLVKYWWLSFVYKSWTYLYISLCSSSI